MMGRISEKVDVQCGNLREEGYPSLRTDFEQRLFPYECPRLATPINRIK